MAERYGRETHPAESVSLSVAMSELLGECFHCFPENVPADAKPCQVLSGGVWVDGFLLEWQRGADGRWKGLVNYRHEAGRRVALKDQAELRPAGINTTLCTTRVVSNALLVVGRYPRPGNGAHGQARWEDR